MKLSSFISSVGFYILALTVFLTPLFFLPFTPDYYEFNKQILLFTSALILLFVWALEMVFNKQIHLTRSPLGIPLLFVVTSWVLSSIIKSPNKFSALFNPTQTGTILALSIIFLAATNLVKTKRQLEFLFYSLVLSISLLGIQSLIWGSGLITSLLPFAFLQNNLWSPTGNSLSAISLLLLFVPVLLIPITREKFGSTKSLILSISLLICLSASILSIYRLFGTNNITKPSFLPQSTGWAIALEALKGSPFIGTGPATYTSNFTQFRPSSYNLTPLWAIRFSNSSNYYLEILSTLGIFGLLAYLFLASKTIGIFYKTLRTSSESQLHTYSLTFGLGASIIFVAQLFIPTNLTIQFFLITLVLLLVITLKIMGSSLIQEANIDLVSATDNQKKSALLPSIVLALALIAILPSSYAMYKVYKAEHLFQISTRAAAANDGRKTYDTLIQAIKTNPYQDSYRVAYSQTNILLANSIANQKSLSDSDRNTIGQLVQQAIREAKNTTALNPTKVVNLENLASIYKSLIGSVKDADTWAIASYQQTIRLDPVNPNLRIALGGVYFSLKNYDEATNYFQQAATLKPDLPNAYYNLSATYKEVKDYPKAIIAMQSVVDLVDQTSADYPKAVAELETLQKLAGEAALSAPTPLAPAKTELESPKPFPTPKISPIKLPTGLGPETNSQITSSPTPAQ